MNALVKSMAMKKIADLLSDALDSGELDDIANSIYDEGSKLIISDTRKKIIKRALAAGGDLHPCVMNMIAEEAGASPEGYGLDAMSSDDDSVVSAYANHIKNYLYTYKDEATDIDPSIDPSEKQIGPMAQDIEQVNPACVKELEDGTKVVDTEKLALMNAGAIADLARELNALKGGTNGKE